MFVLVHQNILRLDVSMRNRQHTQIVEPAIDLVDVYLSQQGRYLLLLHQLVQVVRKVVHHDVQVLLLPLVRQKTVFHHQVVRVPQHLQNRVLPVLVLLVLEHLLYRYLLARRTVNSEVHHPESTLTCHSLNLVLGTR